MNEFDIIATYFAPLAPGGLRDDAAVLDIPAGQQLVVTSDTLNEGTHFLSAAKPEDIAQKALRVNLSDLAAMGAKPLAYQLNLAFTKKPTRTWLEKFTGALAADQQEFGITCSGGDTTSTKGPLSISITAMGLVPEGKAISRGGAKEGDVILLSGPIGDAYIGLHMLSYLAPHPALPPQGQKADFGQGAEKYFIDRYYRPQPRLDLLTPLREHARAAIDISDGLLADLGHICKASNLSADIHATHDLFSPAVKGMIKGGLITAEELLSGGDDYQLLIAVAPENVDAFLAQAKGCVRIGVFTKVVGQGESQVHLLGEDGQPIETKHTGWSHF